MKVLGLIEIEKRRRKRFSKSIRKLIKDTSDEPAPTSLNKAVIPSRIKKPSFLLKTAPSKKSLTPVNKRLNNVRIQGHLESLIGK